MKNETSKAPGARPAFIPHPSSLIPHPSSLIPPPSSFLFRLAVSALLAWHLVALLAGPLTVPPSILGDELARVYRPYAQMFFLDSAYKFFAPDPGPSHHIRYELMMPDGSVEEGEFPNREEYRPALRYSRHLVLCEFLNVLPRGTLNPSLAFDRFRQGSPPTAFPVLARSYGWHLLHVSGAEGGTLYLVARFVPDPSDVAAGRIHLDDESLEASERLGFYRLPGWQPRPPRQPAADEEQP